MSIDRKRILGTRESAGIFKKELDQTEKKESRLLNIVPKENRIKQSIYELVPPTLRTTLEGAFEKAFMLVFMKGTGIIEKTFDKETALLEFEAGNYVVDKTGSRKSIKRLDKEAKKSNLLNHAATSVTGFGLGLLGMGLPDIPLLVSTLLKGIYEVALGYGISYESTEEKIYILRLICTALAEGNQQTEYNRRLEGMQCQSVDEGGVDYQDTEKNVLDMEIKSTAKILSDALLVEKFVQGIPIVGVLGGFVNHAVYRKVAAMAAVKYKKRYLLRKIEEN